MSQESHLTGLFSLGIPAEIQKQVQELPADLVREPTVDELRATDAVFAQEPENRVAAGLIGLWASIPMLHAVAAETFDESTEEDDPRLKEKKKGKPDRRGGK